MSATLAPAAEPVLGRITSCLRERYGELKHSAKKLARAAGTTPRTAENWLAGECAPRTQQLLILMARDSAFRAEMIALVDEIQHQEGGL